MKMIVKEVCDYRHDVFREFRKSNFQVECIAVVIFGCTAVCLAVPYAFIFRNGDVIESLGGAAFMTFAFASIVTMLSLCFNPHNVCRIHGMLLPF